MTSPLVDFVNPANGVSLSYDDSGFLIGEDGERFVVLHDIPRFCPSQNYSQSFGYQWAFFHDTQLDNYSGSSQSFHRFYAETGWSPEELSHCSVLEVGSGAGRFTEVFLRTTNAFLHSVDYSSAVDVNWRNNKIYSDRLRLAQASIYELPFPDRSFEKIFCLGVLQHTPSFEASVAALISKANIGGEIVVDFYPVKGWYTKVHSKYMIRPFSKRLPKPLLLALIRSNISWMLWLFDFLCINNLAALTRFIPITDIRLFPAGLTKKQRREWAIMDTFDALSPAYDNPQRLKDVVCMFERRGCEVTFAGLVSYTGGSSTVVRAIRRKSSSL